MPKRSDRDLYGDVFDSNPFEDLKPEDMYAELRWGNDPEDIFPIESPEPLATIGELARLKLQDYDDLRWSETDNPPFLAVGRDTNLLYIVPKTKSGRPLNIPRDGYEAAAEIKQTDYYSDKGGEECYYYHNHEKPYPILLVHKSGVSIIIPATYKNKRSYAVGKEGIVG